MATNGSKNHAPTPASDDIEHALTHVPGVHGASIVFDSSGRITEVHVLAVGDRTPKQIMRDVTTTLHAGFGISIDYRTVSVARLDAELVTPEPAQPKQKKKAARPVVDAVTATSQGNATEVRVQVTHDGREAEGSARGPASGALRLAAVAAVNARADLMGDGTVEVRTAELVQTSDGQLIALVTLRSTTSRGEETWVGAAQTRKDTTDAVVRATFAAMNRTITTAEA